MLVALNSVFQVIAFCLPGWFYLSVLPGWLSLPKPTSPCPVADRQKHPDLPRYPDSGRYPTCRPANAPRARLVRDRQADSTRGSFWLHIRRTSAAGVRNAHDAAGHATIRAATDLVHVQDQVASRVCSCWAAHQRLMRSLFQSLGGVAPRPRRQVEHD